MLVHDLLFNNLKYRGDRPALLREKTCVSYAQAAPMIEDAANGLRSIGLGAGERVAVYLNKRLEGVVTYFSASLAGTVFVPINPVLKPAQVGHILNDCAVSVLVTTGVLAMTLEDEIAECHGLRGLVVVDESDHELKLPPHVVLYSWSDLLTMPEANQTPVRRIDNDIAAILYTSGSTGSPKGVVLSHRNITAGAISVSEYLGNCEDDVILAALPLSFDAGFSQLTTAFAAGSSVVLMDYLLPQDVPKAISRYRVTALTGVPPLWNQLAKLSWPNEAGESLRYIANTGGAMPTATLNKLRTLLPSAKVFLMYGLTESFRSTYLPPEEVDARPTSIGKAIPNAEILVVNDDGSLCGAGEPGELVHRGALVSLGYWNDPERSALRFRPVPTLQPELPFKELAVWSGDTVVKDQDGFLYFVGRKDDMIKSSGYRISPTEVEEVVFGSGLVTECAALGVPHPEIGQAVVVAANSPNPNDDTAGMLVDACKRALPNFMVPAKIVWLDVLPKNPNGKIDRKQLVRELTIIFQEEE